LKRSALLIRDWARTSGFNRAEPIWQFFHVIESVLEFWDPLHAEKNDKSAKLKAEKGVYLVPGAECSRVSTADLDRAGVPAYAKKTGLYRAMDDGLLPILQGGRRRTRSLRRRTGLG
jgi:hypothetical protein